MRNELGKSTENAKEIRRRGRRRGATIDKYRGNRVLSECLKLFAIDENRAQRFVGRELGYSGSTVAGWFSGSSIDNNALAKLDELGADVRYILTGRRMPTGDCQHGKVCERLPMLAALLPEIVSAFCAMRGEHVPLALDMIEKAMKQIAEAAKEPAASETGAA